MPRSYSFDHFQVPSAEPRSRSLRRQDKQQYAGSQHEGREELEQDVHYGRSYAETEALFHAYAEERQQTPLTAQEGGHASTKFAHGRPAAQAVLEQAQAREAEQPAVRSTAPIGSVPKAEEVLPQGRMQDLLDEASRQVQVLQTGLGDVTRAASRLASLPLEAVRLAARRLRLVHG